MIKSFCLILALSTAWVTGWAPLAAEPFRVKITQHPALTPLITAAEADQILADMAAALRRSQPSCNVQFVRDGDPTYFFDDNASASIDYEAEWQAYADVPGTVKIVADFSWCGVPGPSFADRSIGGPIWLVTHGHKDLDSIIWLHEYSHTAGNDHRVDDTNALMQPAVNTNTVNVTGDECSSLLAGTSSGGTRHRRAA